MHDANSPLQLNASPSAAAPGERHELRFRFECETIEAFGALYAPDISRGGIFIRTLDVLPLASAVKLELLLADETAFITAEGLVFWTRAADQAGTQGEPGMGIRFTRMSQESHRNLTRILVVKKAEERIREAAAAAEAEAEAQDEESSWTEEVNTLVATSADLLAAVARGGNTAPPDAPATEEDELPADVTVVAAALPMRARAVVAAPGVPRDAVAEAAEGSPIATAPIVAVPSSPSGRSLSRPLPLLPDWAFVSTRFGAETPAAGDGAAVPQHIPDIGDTSFGARGSVATVATPVSPKSPRGWSKVRRHTGLSLVAGAALVLITTLALAPRSKRFTPSARPRAGLVSPPAARATAPTAAIELAPASERVVSQAAEQPGASRAR